MDNEPTLPTGSRRAGLALLAGAVVLLAAAVGTGAALGAAGRHDRQPGGAAGVAAAGATVVGRDTGVGGEGQDPGQTVTRGGGRAASRPSAAARAAEAAARAKLARHRRPPAGRRAPPARRPPRPPAPPCPQLCPRIELDPAHYPWHLDTLGHLGLVYLATLVFVAGALLSGKGLLDAKRTASLP